MFILYENEYCDHYSIVIALWPSYGLLLYSILLDRIVLASFALQAFYIQWSSRVVVFQEILVHMIQELHKF